MTVIKALDGEKIGHLWPGNRVISLTGTIRDVEWTATNGVRATIHWDGNNLSAYTNQ